jgi:hypothetical protein
VVGLNQTDRTCLDLASNSAETIFALAPLWITAANTTSVASVRTADETNGAVNATKTTLAVALSIVAVAVAPARRLVAINTTRLLLAVFSRVTGQTLADVFFTDASRNTTLLFIASTGACRNLAVFSSPPIVAAAKALALARAMAVAVTLAESSSAVVAAHAW